MSKQEQGNREVLDAHNLQTSATELLKSLTGAGIQRPASVRDSDAKKEEEFIALNEAGSLDPVKNPRSGAKGAARDEDANSATAAQGTGLTSGSAEIIDLAQLLQPTTITGQVAAAKIDMSGDYRSLVNGTPISPARGGEIAEAVHQITVGEAMKGAHSFMIEAVSKIDIGERGELAALLGPSQAQLVAITPLSQVRIANELRRAGLPTNSCPSLELRLAA